jgi:O-antigen ligase
MNQRLSEIAYPCLRYGLVVLSFLLPLSQYISVRLLFVLLVLSVITCDKARLARLFYKAWGCLLYMFFLVAGLSYSSQLESGLRVLETSFPLLALPLVFCSVGEVTRRYIFTLFRFFSLGLLTACTILSVHAIYRSVFDLKTVSITYYAFTNLLDFQPTYFSYYLVFGITLNFFLFFYDDARRENLQMMSVLIFFCCLLFSASKTTFVTLTLVLAFFLLRFLNEDRTSNKIIATVLALSMLVSIFIVHMAGPFHREQGDAWDRSELWDASIHAIPSILLGTGTGADRAALIDYFSRHRMAMYADESFNAHNQVIQVLLSNGVLGLLSFLLLLCYPLYRATKAKNMLAVISLFPFVVYGITEVFLGRYQGIVFFVFLHQAFSWLIACEERDRLMIAT